MTISDEQYQAWLADTDARRVVLAEVQCFQLGSVTTQYMASAPYVSAPTDTPANTAYDDIIKAIPLVRQSLGEAFSGQASISAGDMLVDNSGGERDLWLGYAWYGRPVTLYLGAPDWPKADFRVIMRGVVLDIASPDGATLAIKLRDKQAALNVQVQAATTGNSMIPLCFGQCFNIEPLLIDAGTSTYQVHDGAIFEILAVRDNGIALAYPGGYTKDLAHGKFALTSAAVGRITCDIQGAVDGASSFHFRAADLVEHLITTYSTLASADLDGDSFYAMNTTCPQTLGIYLRDRANLLDVINELVTSVGGWHAFSRDGLLQLGRIGAISQQQPWPDMPVLYLTADDVSFRSFRVKSRSTPLASVRLGYRRNWTVQADGLAETVPESDRALYSAAESVAGAGLSYFGEDPHLLRQNPPTISTLLADGAAAATEAGRRMLMLSGVSQTFEATFFAAPFRVSLGKLIHLTHPRFGFAGGLLARVVGIKEDTLRCRTTLDLWL